MQLYARRKLDPTIQLPEHVFSWVTIEFDAAAKELTTRTLRGFTEAVPMITSSCSKRENEQSTFLPLEHIHQAIDQEYNKSSFSDKYYNLTSQAKQLRQSKEGTHLEAQMRHLIEFYDFVLAERREDLDFSDHLDATVDCGFIDPDGRFYPCFEWGHDHLAGDVLDITPQRMMEENWIKVAKGYWNIQRDPSQRSFIGARAQPSDKQKRTLRRIGREATIDQHCYRDEGVTFEKAFPGGLEPMKARVRALKAGRTQPVSDEEDIRGRLQKIISPQKGHKRLSL